MSEKYLRSIERAKKRHGMIRHFGIFFTAASVAAYAANQAPSVNAGEDQTNGSTGNPSYLIGDVSDDATSYESLEISWLQISGPAQAQIQVPASATTGVTFPDSGIYAFELRVSDGSLSSKDTVLVRVRRHLPFRLLAPSGGEPIEIGKPYVVRWQMDPSIPCTVWFTINDGLNWTMLTDQGSVRDSFVWQVPDSFEARTGGRIWVHEYMNAPNEAEGAGEFVFVNATRVMGQGRRGAIGAARTVKNPTVGFFTLSGRRIPIIPSGFRDTCDIGSGLLFSTRGLAHESGTTTRVR